MSTSNSAADLKIFVSVDKNPKRSGAKIRFEHYRDGMTPAEYVEKVGNRAQAHRDLTWDLEHGYIRLASIPNDNHNSH